MILIPTLRKNLTKHASFLRIHGSLSLRLFTASTEQELVSSPAILDLLLDKHQFSPQVATKVASVLNGVKDTERSDSTLSFLKERGFSKGQLEKLVKHRPQLLLASLEDTIKPKVRAFEDLGFCSDDTAIILSSNPLIFHMSLNNRVVPAFLVLKGLLGADEAVFKLLRKFAWFLHCDLEKTLVPNVEFLKSCDIPMDRIIRHLHLNPFFLLLKPEVVRKSVEKAEQMGVSRSSNMFIYAVQVCSTSDKAWELKLQAFRDCGFSDSDIKAMFGKAPLIFTRSTENIARTRDVLLSTGKYDMSCIVNHPGSFGHSIEKRYNPRFQILQFLERKNLIKKWPSLGRISVMTDQQFFKQFVDPYLSEVGDLCVAKSFAMGKREK